MKSEAQKLYIELSHSHFWMKGRRNTIKYLIKSLKVPLNAKIIDIGCESGQLLKELKNIGYQNLTGIDIWEEALIAAKSNGIPNVYLMNATELAFDDGTFDILIASDVLEHIEDDKKALKEWYRVLKIGGKAIIFVPAFQFLWSNHDIDMYHFRRYTKFTLKKKCKDVGFNIISSSYWNFLLFFPVALVRKIKFFSQNDGKGDLKKHNPIVNKLFYSILELENNLLRFVNFPIGLSVFVIAEKK